MIRFVPGLFKDSLGLLFGERARNSGAPTVCLITGPGRTGCGFGEDRLRTLGGSGSCLGEDCCGLLLGVGDNLGSFRFALGSESFELCDHRLPLGLEESNPIIQFLRLRLEFCAPLLGGGDYFFGSLLCFAQDLFSCLRNLGIAAGIRSERRSQFVGKSLDVGRQAVSFSLELFDSLLPVGLLSGKDVLGFALRSRDDLVGLSLRILNERRAIGVELPQLGRQAGTIGLEYGDPLLVADSRCSELGFRLLLGFFRQHCTVDGKLLQFGRQTIAFELEFGNPLTFVALAGLEDTFGLDPSRSDNLVGLPLRISDGGRITTRRRCLFGDSIGLALDGCCPVARLGLDLRCLLAGATQHSVLGIEDRDHGAVHRLSFRRPALLSLELCLLESGLRVLGPMLELAEVGLKFAEEFLDFALVIALAAGGELACVDGLWKIGGFLAHDRVIGQAPRYLDGQTSHLR